MSFKFYIDISLRLVQQSFQLLPQIKLDFAVTAKYMAAYFVFNVGALKTVSYYYKSVQISTKTSF